MLVSVLSIIVLMVGAPADVKGPEWVRIPSPDDFADHYPYRARNAWLDGKATIVCRVSVKGRFNNCEVVEESPKGYGFGAAALGLSGLFEMRPPMRDGVPVGGETARIPIVFRMPQMEMSDLDIAVHCYGLRGAEADANPSDPEMAAAAKALSDSIASAAGRGGLSWDAVRAAMAAARAKPTTDPELAAGCRQDLEGWTASRP